MATSHPADNLKAAAILVVGSGLFGLTTAFELSQRGYTNITVLDRFLPPVPDGSSVDISRIVRVDYADPTYSQMASEALARWKTDYKQWYYPAGYALLAHQKDHPYIKKSKEQLLRQGQGSLIREYHNKEELRKQHPMLTPSPDSTSGYENPDAGWANAAGSIQHLARLCSIRGVCFITGKRGTVLSLDIVGNNVKGVKVASGEQIAADRVILACGAWTNRLVDLGGATVATGQPVGFIQLTHEEAERLREMPICINYTTGVFIFPPTPDTNVLKLARHGYGYETSVAVAASVSRSNVSAPLLVKKDVENPYIPPDASDALREGLAEILPEFARRPWLKTRLCWYMDTETGDFIMDHHPKIGNLFIAAGGSGQ